MTDKDKVKAAFKALRKIGYIARQNFLCCSGCANAQLANEVEAKGGDLETAKHVYYHQQCNDAFRDKRDDLTPDLHGVLFIHWQGDGVEIVRALREQGLDAIWPDGDSGRCIEVRPTGGTR